MLSWLRRLRSPYVYVLMVEPIDENFDVVFGVFTSLEKAKQAEKDWKLSERDLSPHILTLLADYRTMTAPPKYWSPNDERSNHPAQ